MSWIKWRCTECKSDFVIAGDIDGPICPECGGDYTDVTGEVEVTDKQPATAGIGD